MKIPSPRLFAPPGTKARKACTATAHLRGGERRGHTHRGTRDVGDESVDPQEQKADHGYTTRLSRRGLHDTSRQLSLAQVAMATLRWRGVRRMRGDDMPPPPPPPPQTRPRASMPERPCSCRPCHPPSSPCPCCRTPLAALPPAQLNLLCRRSARQLPAAPAEASSPAPAATARGASP